MSTLTHEPVAPTTSTALHDPPRGRPRWPRLLGWGAISTAFGAVVAAAGFGLADRDSAVPALGPGVVTVEVGIDHSRFDVDGLRVNEGTIVRFVVHNNDPIDHELIVGDAEVHRRHRTGSEQQHPPAPGEVSVSPGGTAVTFYEFDTPGTVVLACHLPGHEAYGMRGEIKVISNQRL
ncbi:MAG: multicopper oxidase domain-containing protein [Microthrixaceae bacterium]